MSRPVPPRSRPLPLLVAALALALQPAAAQQQRPFVEHVEVARVLIDVRVFDERGQPMIDLDSSNFAVKIAGRAVRVESAEWVGARREDQPLSAKDGWQPQEPCLGRTFAPVRPAGASYSSCRRISSGCASPG